MNSKEFGLKIESIVKEKRISYIDAIVWYCDQNDIDTSSISSMINKSLKEKLKEEAINLRLLKDSKTGKLPI